MTPIKNIIFDLGGVIVDLDLPTALKAFARLGVMPEGISLEEMSKNGIPRNWSMIRLMHAMDIGDMGPSEFVATLKTQCLPGTRDEDIVKAFNTIIRTERKRLLWVKALKQHHKVFLLSNIGQLHWDETLRQTEALGCPIGSCFDRMFLSYQLRMVKPDERIFRHLISETGIDPAETLYIDDLPDNIEAGRHVGLVAHKIDCNGLDQAMSDIAKAL